MMYDKVFAYVQEKAFFTGHQKVLIAVSGGVDSMNLLHFLHCHKDDLDIELGLAHVNHGQRPESQAEETYLRQWANQENYPIYIGTFQGSFSEQLAREYRYAFFKKIMTENGYTALVTAHHADDQAETILMRLIRGSRLRHLIGIKEVQDFAGGQLIRPFLPFTKADLPSPFHFEDSSNQSPSYFRNRVRQTYFPILSQENPQFSKHLIHVSHETKYLFQALTDLTRHLQVTNCAIFQAQTQAVQYFLLQYYLATFPDLQLSKFQFEQLLAHLRNSKNYDYRLKTGYYFRKTQDTFEIVTENHRTLAPPTILVKKGQVRFNEYQLTWLEQQKKGGLALKSSSPIRLRYRQVGDVLDFGSYHKKLRRWFIDEKIPPIQREQALIGEQDGQIIFVLTKNKTYLRKLDKHDIIEGIILIENEEEKGQC